MISITSSIRDYAIVRAIGGSKKQVENIVVAETFIIIGRSFPLGLIFGLISVFLFLIRYPIIPTSESLINIIILIVLQLAYLGISSMMSRRIAKQSVIEVLQLIQ